MMIKDVEYQFHVAAMHSWDVTVGQKSMFTTMVVAMNELLTTLSKPESRYEWPRLCVRTTGQLSLFTHWLRVISTFTKG